jgi:hypothetical protein
MDDLTKRDFRQLKRELKRSGGKRRRRELKRGLAEDPEEAHETEAGFGRSCSAPLNGNDHDATRRRPGRSGEGR